MKKVGLLLLVLPLMVALVSSVVLADDQLPNDPTLWAGQDEAAGFVHVGNSLTTLTVRYNTGETGWCIMETHLHVAGDVGDIPHTKKGNPIPGHFAWAGYHDCVHTVTYTMPLDREWGIEIAIAAHAVVKDPCGCREETAWACGDPFPGSKNWATYFIYAPG